MASITSASTRCWYFGCGQEASAERLGREHHRGRVAVVGRAHRVGREGLRVVGVHQIGRFRSGVPAIRPRLHCISITERYPDATRAPDRSWTQPDAIRHTPKAVRKGRRRDHLRAEHHRDPRRLARGDRHAVRRAWPGRRPPRRRTDAGAGRRHARARRRRSRRGARHPAPAGRHRHPPRRRDQRGAGRMSAGDVPGGAHRGPRVGPARDEPARRERDDASGRPHGDRARRDRHRGAVRVGRGRVRPGEPRQRHRRTRGATPPAARRRCATRIGRRRHARPTGEVHVLRGRAPRRVALGGLRGESRRAHTERGDRALWRRPPQRARHGEGRRPAAHPRQDRVDRWRRWA